MKWNHNQMLLNPDFFSTTLSLFLSMKHFLYPLFPELTFTGFIWTLNPPPLFVAIQYPPATSQPFC